MGTVSVTVPCAAGVRLPSRMLPGDAWLPRGKNCQIETGGTPIAPENCFGLLLHVHTYKEIRNMIAYDPYG